MGNGGGGWFAAPWSSSECIEGDGLSRKEKKGPFEVRLLPNVRTGWLIFWNDISWGWTYLTERREGATSLARYLSKYIDWYFGSRQHWVDIQEHFGPENGPNNSPDRGLFCGKGNSYELAAWAMKSSPIESPLRRQGWLWLVVALTSWWTKGSRSISWTKPKFWLEFGCLLFLKKPVM